MERLLARRAALLEGGARSLGWKVAFGTPAAGAALGLDGPVVGFLTDATLLRSGARCAVGSWTAPKLEPEIAIRIGRRVDPGAGEEAASAAIAGLSAAIELADLDVPAVEDLEGVVGGNVYHRAVVLSDDPPAPGPPSGPIAVTVARDGTTVAETGDAEAAVGRLPGLVAHVARYLAEFGCELSPGEVVISGSTVPLIEVGPGETVRSVVAGAGAVEVVLA